MTKPLEDLLDNNHQWAEQVNQQDPGFFAKLSSQQSPEYLWIGCSDSRVPANEIVGLLPGELFVHRNVANVVLQTDINCLSVIQYAVAVLKVKHIIICGHYGCGGVIASMDGTRHGLIDNWLRPIQQISRKHQTILQKAKDGEHRSDRLCELNVIEQVMSAAHCTFIQDAWDQKQDLTIHGWVYGLQDGKVRDLNMSSRSYLELDDKYVRAVAMVNSSVLC
ncbi:carbonate dehydratase [Pelagibaculum spongiae]|uniref:Carbonic anhydrase n=1 Tax=Pelagibaculum spongiae TaxID=2080658 RepID=A0A2V1GNW2_9GAMM|nr:carbonate dehydratase [Pelagibaculum spongiae]PVZ63573.1 carbonate dehydratase [Pelagibaculum spongiae]